MSGTIRNDPAAGIHRMTGEPIPAVAGETWLSALEGQDLRLNRPQILVAWTGTQATRLGVSEGAMDSVEDAQAEGRRHRL